MTGNDYDRRPGASGPLALPSWRALHDARERYIGWEFERWSNPLVHGEPERGVSAPLQCRNRGVVVVGTTGDQVFPHRVASANSPPAWKQNLASRQQSAFHVKHRYCEEMVRLLITGMSGVGKSSVLRELGERGYPVIDTDYGYWTTDSGLWDDVLMGALLGESTEVVVSGTVENQGEFYDRFDHVVLLSAPVAVLLDRVRRRTTNPYGSTAAEREEITSNQASVEPRLRATATVEIDATQPLEYVVDRVEELLRRPDRST